MRFHADGRWRCQAGPAVEGECAELGQRRLGRSMTAHLVLAGLGLTRARPSRPTDERAERRAPAALALGGALVLKVSVLAYGTIEGHGGPQEPAHPLDPVVFSPGAQLPAALLLGGRALDRFEGERELRVVHHQDLVPVEAEDGALARRVAVLVRLLARVVDKLVPLKHKPAGLPPVALFLQDALDLGLRRAGGLHLDVVGFHGLRLLLALLSLHLAILILAEEVGVLGDAAQHVDARIVGVFGVEVGSLVAALLLGAAQDRGVAGHVRVALLERHAHGERALVRVLLVLLVDLEAAVHVPKEHVSGGEHDDERDRNDQRQVLVEGRDDEERSDHREAEESKHDNERPAHVRAEVVHGGDRARDGARRAGER
mmetsp:Transcript_4699/g.10138  ORF Transcript_4699/g.10138 Transcript_4699/m.10138 type:complete len:372 (-) Transcript_4699:263-1378(-)